MLLSGVISGWQNSLPLKKSLMKSINTGFKFSFRISINNKMTEKSRSCPLSLVLIYRNSRAIIADIELPVDRGSSPIWIYVSVKLQFSNSECKNAIQNAERQSLNPEL